MSLHLTPPETPRLHPAPQAAGTYAITLDDATYHQKRYMKEVLYTYRDIRQRLKETYGTYPRALDVIANADSEKWRIKPWLEKIGINESIFSEIEALAERAAYAQKNSFYSVYVKGSPEWTSYRKIQGPEKAIEELEILKSRLGQEDLNLVREFEAINQKVFQDLEVHVPELDIADDLRGRKYVEFGESAVLRSKGPKGQWGSASPKFARTVSAFSLAALLGATVSEKVKAHNESLAESETTNAKKSWLGTAQ